MTRAYVNYPNPRATIHGEATCAEIRKMRKTNQRVITIDETTFQQVMKKLRTGDFRFAATESMNDVWISIDFGDPTFEEGAVAYVLKILARRYSPLKSIVPKRHC